MKQPRKLTRAEKIHLSNLGYDPARYACERVLDGMLHLVDKHTDKKLCVEM